jgi:hypothetical protein
MQSARNSEKYRARYGVLWARPLKRRDIGGTQRPNFFYALKSFYDLKLLYVPQSRRIEIHPTFHPSQRPANCRGCMERHALH